MLNYLTHDAEHCTFGGYNKNIFLFNVHNSAKNHSTIKPVKYAQEVPINPLTFHLNCISSIREVVQMLPLNHGILSIYVKKAIDILWKLFSIIIDIWHVIFRRIISKSKLFDRFVLSSFTFFWHVCSKKAEQLKSKYKPQTEVTKWNNANSFT